MSSAHLTDPHVSQDHVDRLIGRYIHGQLSPRQRRAVQVHIAQCESCRLKIDQAGDLQTRLQSDMPRVGLPERSTISAIRSNVMAQVRADLQNGILAGTLNRPSRRPRATGFGYGMIQFSTALLALALMFALVTSVTAAFAHPVTHRENLVPDLPNQAVPGDVHATWTPVVTDEWIKSGSKPGASLTAVALIMSSSTPTLSMGASPAPPAR